MIKKAITISILSLLTFTVHAQKKRKILTGMYLQWGYNTEWYTKSNIHFSMPNGTNFILHHAKATDRPDMDAIYKKPMEVSIPQYNYRIGFYLNRKHTKAIEINFDHQKSDCWLSRVTAHHFLPTI